jgi:4-amino-4-deoxy-L-arabinose transferase-like glycosyltransferase
VFLRATRLAIAIATIGIPLITLFYPIHTDVRYGIGVQAVSGQSPAFTFTHRPLLYRVLTEGFAWPAEMVTTTVWRLEVVLRVEAAAVALGASILLWIGLRQHRANQALPIAGVVFAALILMSPSAVLQPDWCAVVLTVAGVGAALAGRNDLLSAVAGGVLLAAAAAVKVVTLPVAVIGLLALAILSRRRALIALLAATATGLLYLAAVAIWLPHEIGWMKDIRLLQPSPRPLRTQLERLGGYLVNMVVLWPLVAMLPAAIVGLRGRHQVMVAGTAVLALAPAVLQDQYFPYHSPALPVVAAVAVLLALHRNRQRAVPALFLLVLAGWTAWVLATPYPRLPQQLPVWTAAAAVAGLVAWLWQRRASRPDLDSPPPASMSSGLAVAVTFLATATPVAAQSVSLRGTEAFNPTERAAATERQLETARRLHEVIGQHSTVSYLAFGDIAYLLRNPVDCRYPSPVFLQRSRYSHRHEGSRSWTESLACIRDAPGQWLVRDTAWFKLAGQPSAVTDVLTATFDCDRAVTVSTFVVCPRRS